MRKKTAIIVLSWNNYKDTSICLNSLKKIDRSNCDILLVDNGSTDDSIERLKAEYPDVKCIVNDRNYGFAEGNNIGIRRAIKMGAEYILLLNNDTEVAPNFVSELVCEAEKDEKIGILGPKIYFNDSNIIWFAGGFLNKRTGFTFHRGEDAADRGQYDQNSECDFISGCAMLVKKDVFAKIGFLDPDYYHSHEDADLCLRAGFAGFKCIYVPTSIVYHKLAISSGGRRSPFYLYYRTRNHLLFIYKQKLKSPLLWPKFVFLIIKRIIGSFLYKEPKGAYASVAGILDFYYKNWGAGNGNKYR